MVQFLCVSVIEIIEISVHFSAGAGRFVIQPVVRHYGRAARGPARGPARKTGMLTKLVLMT